jgi:hypothetical protein
VRALVADLYFQADLLALLIVLDVSYP